MYIKYLRYFLIAITVTSIVEFIWYYFLNDEFSWLHVILMSIIVMFILSILNRNKK